jgi:hypothetical protein
LGQARQQGNPALNYWLLSTLAKLFRAAVLQPVPNPGGTESLQTEVRRLRSFKAKGCACRSAGHGRPGLCDAPSGPPGRRSSIAEQCHRRSDCPGRTAHAGALAKGLEAIQQAHARGEVLSQAVARNMVVCADGVIGFIDFEDDPAAHLPQAVCMARDALNYAQSTALFLQQAGALEQARPGSSLCSSFPPRPGRCWSAPSTN